MKQKEESPLKIENLVRNENHKMEQKETFKFKIKRETSVFDTDNKFK